MYYGFSEAAGFGQRCHLALGTDGAGWAFRELVEGGCVNTNNFGIIHGIGL